MRALKKTMAMLLAAVLLLGALPAAALGEEDTPLSGAVVYNLGDYNTIVLNEPASEEEYDAMGEAVTARMDPEAEDRWEASGFFTGGNYEITIPGETILFPYEIQFQPMGEEKQSVWFETEEDTAEIAGHTFSLALQPNAEALYLGSKDDADLQAFLAKEFRTDGSSATPLSRNKLDTWGGGRFYMEPMRLKDPGTVTLSELVETAQRNSPNENVPAVTSETPIIWKTYRDSGSMGSDYGPDQYHDGEYDDRYHVGTGADTIDVAALMDQYGTTSSYDHSISPVTSFYVEFIVGKTDSGNSTSQSSADRVRGTITVDSYAAYLSMGFYGSDGASIGGTTSVMDTRFFDAESGRNISVYNYSMSVYDSQWAEGKTINLKLSPSGVSDILTNAGEGASLEIYTGYYENMTELTNAGAQKITNQILAASGSESDLAAISGYPVAIPSMEDLENWSSLPKFTLVLEGGTDGSRVLLPFGVWIIRSVPHFSRVSGLYAEISSGYYRNISVDSQFENGVYTYYLQNDMYPVNGTYYYRMSFSNPESRPFSDYVSITANGVPLSSAELEQLFRINGGYGLPRNYSGSGVTFVLNYTNSYTPNPNGTETFTVRTAPYVAPPSQPGPPSVPDPGPSEPAPGPVVYPKLTITGAKDYINNRTSYVMQERDDGYYQYGYQTVLLSGVADGTVEITPTFTVSNTGRVIVQDKDETNKPLNLEERNTPVDFENGKPVQYTAYSSEQDASSTTRRNYWVTYVTKSGDDADLFVNGVTNIADTHRDTNDGNKPVRLVDLKDANSYHDIFVANIGGTDITDLKVELLDGQNVQLDSYWTFNGDTLAAFPENLVSNSDDELPNIGKIRLIPVLAPKEAETDPDIIQAGIISGTLRITYTKGGAQQQIDVKLTGVSGDLRLTNNVLRRGVKWVPYVSAVQDNTMINSQYYRYTFTGTLPQGLEFTDAGEIYGVPQEYGEYQLQVQLTYTGPASSILTGVPDGVDIRFLTPEEREDIERRLSCEGPVTLIIEEPTPYNVHEVPGEEGYRYVIETHVGNPQGDFEFILDRIEDKIFQSSGPHPQFYKFYLDGQELQDGVDYTHEEGSTVITIKAQTFRNAGQGTHVIAAEFFPGGTRTTANTRNMKTSSQTYTYGTGTGGTTGPGSSGGSTTNKTPTRGSTSTSRPAVSVTPGSQEASSSLPFGDDSPTSVFYEDIKWVYDNGLMIGTTDGTFSPGSPLTPGAIVTVLARMTKADLTQYEEEDEEIPADLWYAAAAVWAKQSGLLPEGGASMFQSSLNRGQMAVMLVNYMQAMGMTPAAPENPTAFADAADMTPEAEAAFQILYQYGVFQGTASGAMDPNGITNRGQFAALIHRTFNVISENTQSAS